MLLRESAGALQDIGRDHEDRGSPGHWHFELTGKSRGVPRGTRL
jgi:hypothetical protein